MARDMKSRQLMRLKSVIGGRSATTGAWSWLLWGVTWLS
jgi:hypothetical protein